MCILIDIAAPFIFSINIRTAAEGTRIGRSGEHYAEEVSYRQVQALNKLEASGYRQFENLHARGADFVATATKGGKTDAVTVRPSGTIDTVVT